jgi:hypothetical protein
MTSLLELILNISIIIEEGFIWYVDEVTTTKEICTQLAILQSIDILNYMY